MHRLLVALWVLAAVPAGAQAPKDSAVVADQTEAVVSVVAVDHQRRTVTIRGPKGGTTTLNVPPEAQNLDQVKPGDRFRMKYIESLAVNIQKGGRPMADEQRDVKVSPKGGMPGGVVVRTRTRAVVIDAVDYSNRYIAARVPNGQTIALKVADGIPLEQVSAGDRITVVHTEALAVALERQ